MAARDRRHWLAQMESLLKACADQTRLRILNLLADEGEVSVSHLVAVLNVSQPKVSRHLAYLKRAGLVTDRKDGLLVCYRLALPLPVQAERVLLCLRACYEEVAELQQEVAHLQVVKEGQALRRAARAAPMMVQAPAVTVAAPMATAAEEEERAEMAVELL